MLNSVAVTVNAEFDPLNTDCEALVSQCAVCKVDLRGRFVFADDHVEEMLGLSQEDLFGREFKEFVDESQHAVVDRLFTRHSRFETVFETADLLLYRDGNKPVPVSIIASLNFVAGNPVNFQVVLQKFKSTPQASSADFTTIDRWSAAATILTSLANGLHWTEVVAALNDLTDARETLVYRLTDDHPELVCSSSDPSADPPHATFATEPGDLHLDIALHGGSYDFCESAQVQRAIEQHGGAPSEYLTLIDRGEGGVFLLRLLFNDNDDSASAREGLDRLRLLLPLLAHRGPHSAPEPIASNSTSTETAIDQGLTASPSLRAELLSRLGIGTCVIEPDGRVSIVNDALRAILANHETPASIEPLLDQLFANDDSGSRRVLGAALKEINDHESEAVYETTLRLHNHHPARVSLSRGTGDSRLWLTIATLPVGPTPPSLKHVPDELFNRAESVITECARRLAAFSHAHHAACDMTQRIDLAAVLDGLASTEALVRFVRQTREYLRTPEQPTPLDLNLAMSQIYEHLRRSLPEKTVNLSFADLPTLTTETRKISDLLNAWTFCLARGTSDSTVSISVQARRTNGHISVELSSGAGSSGVNLELCSAISTWPGLDGTTAEIPGSLRFITEAVTASLHGDFRTATEDDGTVRVTFDFLDLA